MSREPYEVRALVPNMPTLDKIERYFRRIDETKWYSNFGPLNSELIKRFSEYFSLDENMLCTISNATVGLQAVLSNIELDLNERVELPSFTFSASASAVILANRSLSFLDIDNEMRCIPRRHAKILLDVLPFGDEPRFLAMNDSYSFHLIDGAASFDALHLVGNNPLMNEKVAIVVSLHSTKLIGGGEGGLILSKNTELIGKIKKWQNFGFDISNSNTRTSLVLGTNAKMSEYSCAVALASMDSWSESRCLYKEISHRALSISKELNLQVHPAMKKGFITPNWIVLPQFDYHSNRMVEEFTEAKIETRKWWNLGCHNMPAFKHLAFDSLENTNLIAKRYLGLPFHLFLENDYWDKVDEILRSCLSYENND